MLSTLVGANSMAYVAASFGGLGKAGLIAVIVVSIILIVTVVWLINGTRKRD
jgi:hypothetical protein